MFPGGTRTDTGLVLEDGVGLARGLFSTGGLLASVSPPLSHIKAKQCDEDE